MAARASSRHAPANAICGGVWPPQAPGVAMLTEVARQAAQSEAAAEAGRLRVRVPAACSSHL